jgi:antitoxin (DNA-binding transcriptional repressor) of toxin-antitoxin stability system
MIRTTLDAAQKQLAELFEAALRGEDVVITRGDGVQRSVRLVVESREGYGAEFGSGKGLFHMVDDFDDSLPDFDDSLPDFDEYQ